MEPSEFREHREFRPATQRKTLVFGLLVIAAGLGWLLHNFEWIPDNVWDIIWSWPMLLIAIGVINISNGHGRGFGAVLVIIGGFFLISRIYDMPISFFQAFWPALLIFIGAMILFGSRKFRCGSKTVNVQEGEDYIEDVAVFSGTEKTIHSSAFRGGRIVSVFGGSTINLTQVTLVPGSEIEVVSVFGGSKILVPGDWNVKMEVFSIFGAYQDKRVLGQVDLNKTITVKGVAIFGGGEIKSY